VEHLFLFVVVFRSRVTSVFQTKFRFAEHQVGNPFADQGGLAKASWSGDEGEFAALLKSLIEQFDEVGTGDTVGAGWRDILLGLPQVALESQQTGAFYKGASLV
jgi:hypothetical protein